MIRMMASSRMTMFMRGLAQSASVRLAGAQEGSGQLVTPGMSDPGSALSAKSAEIEPSSLSTFLRLQSPMPNGSGSASGSDREPRSLAGFLTAAAAHVESSPKQGPKP